MESGEYASKSTRSKGREIHGIDIMQGRKQFGVPVNKGVMGEGEENPLPKRTFARNTKLEDSTGGMGGIGGIKQPFGSGQPFGNQSMGTSPFGGSTLETGMGESRPSGARIKNFRPSSRGNNAG